MVWGGNNSSIPSAIGCNSCQKLFQRSLKTRFDLLTQSNDFSSHWKHHQFFLKISFLEKYLRFKGFIMPVPYILQKTSAVKAPLSKFFKKVQNLQNTKHQMYQTMHWSLMPLSQVAPCSFLVQGPLGLAFATADKPSRVEILDKILLYRLQLLIQWCLNNYIFVALSWHCNENRPWDLQSCSSRYNGVGISIFIYVIQTLILFAQSYTFLPHWNPHLSDETDWPFFQVNYCLFSKGSLLRSIFMYVPPLPADSLHKCTIFGDFMSLASNYFQPFARCYSSICVLAFFLCL